MNKIKLSISTFIVLLLLVCNTGRAQQGRPLVAMFHELFDKDSLKGFDDAAARASALSSGVPSEFPVLMYNYKKDYINSKYGLIKPSTKTLESYLNTHRPAAVPGCSNEDFEASAAAPITASNQVAGWTVTKGYNSSNAPGNTTPHFSVMAYYPNGLPQNATSCNMTEFPVPPHHSEIIDCSAPGGFIDNQIGAQYPIYSVFGTGAPNLAAAASNTQITSAMTGNKVLRLNDGSINDYSIERLSKTFAVSANNALFQFAFISVFATGHDCCTAGGFVIRLSNATTSQAIPCPNFSVSAPSGDCIGGPGTPGYYAALTGVTYTYSGFNSNASVIYNPWKINSMDLTAYIGQNITIDIIVSDCTAGGHYGKIYFDAQCGPMTVVGNGTVFDAGANVSVPTCGAAGATICAADGLGPYSWAGPGVPQAYTIPSMTNQCITTTLTATYTLYMNPAGSCAPISRPVNSTVTPAPLLGASVVQAVCGSTTAVVSLTPAGSAANPSSLSWSPVPLTLNAGTTIATYGIPIGQNPLLVTIVGADPLGCKVTATVNVNPAPPIPTFSIQNATGSNSITCLYPTINLDALTTYSYNNGSLNFFWASANTTYSANSVAIVNAGNYTVTGTDPVTNCSVIHTVNIGVNIAVPSSSVSLLTQQINCTIPAQNVIVTASPSVSITHQIIAPQGGTFVATSYSVSYTPGGTGTFIYILTNDINGCSTTKEFSVTSSQGFPDYDILSPQNFTLGCTTTSCAVLNISNPQSTPPGTPLTYSLLTPGSPSATPPGSLSTISTYTVCTPGTYTVIAKDFNTNCETRVPISVLQNTFVPQLNVIVDRIVLSCDYPSVVLKGTSTTPGVDYQWNFVGPVNTLQSDTITANVDFSNRTKILVNTYTLTVTNTVSTCKSTSVVPIQQNLFAPKPDITGATAITCLTYSITLTNNSTSGILASSGFLSPLPVVGYLWEGPTPQSPLSNSSSYEARTVGEYSLVVKDLNNGCTAVANHTITDNRFYPNLSESKTADTLDCGASQVKLSAVTLTTNPVSSYSYSWTSSSTQTVGANNLKDFPVENIGLYSVLVTNNETGCYVTQEFSVINGSLTADFSLDKESGYAPLTVNIANTSTSSVSGGAPLRSRWNFGNNTTSTISATSVVFNQSGTYTITLYTTKGDCMESTQKVVTVDIPSSLEIPNVFTPNGDKINDVYFVFGKNLATIDFTVFDRWGHVVYQVKSETGGIEWDGKNQYGKESAEGTYFYTMKATGKDGTSFDKKGTISLFR